MGFLTAEYGFIHTIDIVTLAEPYVNSDSALSDSCRMLC